MFNKEKVQEENSEIIEKLIDYSLKVNSCKKLKFNYEKVKSQTKAIFGKNHWSVIQLNGMIFTLSCSIKKYMKLMKPLINKFAIINELPTEIKENLLRIPFGTKDLKQGYVELLSSISDRNYYIILNEGIVLTNKTNEYKSYLVSSKSLLPKGYLILFT